MDIYTRIVHIQFVRGKYNADDHNYLKQLIEYMTENEKQMILTNNFDQIWNYTWCQSPHTNFKQTKEYLDSKAKFEHNINNNYLKTLLICKNTKSNDTEQEWGFPKGRKKIKEADIDCAIREFCEETQLYKDDILINKNVIPFQEIFFGTNNVLYKHVYYIAKIIKDDAKIHIDNSCMEQVREVRALKWFSYDEVLMRIKNHNVERIKIFKKAHSIISASL
jgi:8-oxo-dGTP pyrophosphatase MutT (NUDIX family)